ncbi:MAG: FAD-binding oxidoreductase [Aeromicrobium sp.]
MTHQTVTTSTLTERLVAAGVEHVITPDDPRFADQLAGFNAHVVHGPDVVVAAVREADVRAAVTVARETGAPLVTIGHGHGFVTGADGGVALTTIGMAGVEVDAEQRTARVGAGTRWSEVVEAAAPHGLAPLCGSAPHVGVMGYLLGGGIGPVARTYGYAADHVSSFRVVVGTGEVLVVDHDRHPDLFWALRGGKGGLGVVTEAVVELVPLSTLHAGGFFFSGDDAGEVLHTFATWSATLPETVTTSIALLRLPPLPFVPEPIRGRFVVHVRLAALVDEDEVEAIVAPWRSGPRPLIDAFGVIPYTAIGTVHSDPTEPMAVVEGGRLLSEFTSETVEALLAAAGPGVDVPLVAIEVRQLGGALARTPVVPNAVGGRHAACALHVVGAPVPELLTTVVPAAITALFGALAPWTDGAQVNFIGNANAPEELATCWPEDVRARLATVRDTYDPSGVFPYDGHGGR